MDELHAEVIEVLADGTFLLQKGSGPSCGKGDMLIICGNDGQRELLQVTKVDRDRIHAVRCAGNTLPELDIRIGDQWIAENGEVLVFTHVKEHCGYWYTEDPDLHWDCCGRCYEDAILSDEWSDYDRRPEKDLRELKLRGEL
jgi:hypothetical protein